MGSRGSCIRRLRNTQYLPPIYLCVPIFDHVVSPSLFTIAVPHSQCEVTQLGQPLVYFHFVFRTRTGLSCSSLQGFKLPAQWQGMPNPPHRSRPLSLFSPVLLFGTKSTLSGFTSVYVFPWFVTHTLFGKISFVSFETRSPTKSKQEACSYP